MLSDVFSLSNSKRSAQVLLCPIENKKPDYTFLPPDYLEVTQAIIKKIPLEKLLKHIHFKYADEGLRYTLIHRVYQSSLHEIQYYVPELVYIAVRNMCRPMRKLLVFKASHSESLRRLILWNIKAFTVLMIQRDEGLKNFIESFEEQIVKSVPDAGKFQQSEKAIAMLANASLILKKMPKEEIKDKLKKFIKRYNYEILGNQEHTIMIPFRRTEADKHVNSSYVVRIVEDNCSCFPTRKRVPYRIILETIDHEELRRHPEHLHTHTPKPQRPLPDQDRDLFSEVKEEVDRIFKPRVDVSKFDNKYPFVIDQEQFVNLTKLTNYKKDIENKQKQIEDNDANKRGPIIKRDTIATFKSRVRSSRKEENLIFNRGKFEIKDNEQLRKYDAIYIPTLPSTERKSDSQYPKGIWVTLHNSPERRRYSEREVVSTSKKGIKEIEEEVKYEGTTAESIWKEPWTQTVKVLSQSSPFRKFSSLRFRNMVVKGGDDLRQEIICMQLIYKMQAITKEANVNVFIKPYEIIVLSENSGMLEFVANSISIDGMKKEMNMPLYEFYAEVFNTEPKFLAAKDNFIKSLAGSSILTYVLKLKDRHNGNILLDMDGNIIHIDFGFILGMSPGGLNFESSPFKLTEEYVLLLGGVDSPDYKQFVDLFCEGMLALRRRSDELCLMLEIMMDGSDLECFKKFSIESFKEVFQERMNDAQYRVFCESLVAASCLNSRTANYDYFQKVTNGIMP